MESIKLENVSFAYAGATKKALDNINLSIHCGEFLLVCGQSGCGKTTLLRLLKSSVSPFGEISGNILFEGKELSLLEDREQAARIGFVMQSAENQIVTDKVWHEMAFGLESLGYKTPEIRARVSEMASFFGMESWFYKKVTELSGGQKQLLNLASVMVMQPSVLILDEPTSQLDPISASEFLNTLEKINRELGTTVILTEHRLEEAFPLADRVIVLDEGKILLDDVPRKAGEKLFGMGHSMYKALPTPLKVHSAVRGSLPCPLSVREGRAWLENYAEENKVNPDKIPSDGEAAEGETVLEIKDAWFRYEKNQPDVIKGLSLRVKKGELYCILGGNGTGKTTALSLLSGLYTPQRGKVYINGTPISRLKNLYGGILGVLPQKPESIFLKSTVYDDLHEILSESDLSKADKEKKINAAAELCRLQTLLDRHPYDLSGGEKQRAALCKILLLEPKILLLDEPTKGMDASFKETFAEILSALKEKGKTVLMVSHDIEFCAEYADRCALFFDGAITSEGTARAFFAGNTFYTTAANRMARTCLPKAILAEDIILALGGKTEKKKEKKPADTPKSEEMPRTMQKAALRPKNKKRRIIPALLILFFIPLTIFTGITFLGARKYYFISFMIILETIAAFAAAFESGKPRAREIVLISVLCAVTVAGRAAFFMVPQFKPVLALVIISAICFGGETGFLVGAVTGFVSNFFFGQGPWTPWQMFAFGIVGFLSGVLYKKGILRKTKLSLCVFGFLSTLVLYGGIMNPASIIMWQNHITWEMIAASYLAGLPIDVVHALSTAFFLWFLSDSMIEKLERIKLKYGYI